jgi:hypothetical protein
MNSADTGKSRDTLPKHYSKVAKVWISPTTNQMPEQYVAAAAPASHPLSFGLSRRVPVSHTTRAVGAG